MMGKKVVDKAAVKALVTIYGPREAARISGVKAGTVMGWCSRYKWRKVAADRLPAIAGKDAGDAIRHALETSKTNSTMNLAKYTERASKKAAEHGNPLEVARKVRDVAGVYSTLWPAESENELIAGGILIGEQRVEDNPEELKEILDVREELPGN
jgi:hypothetical protein